MLVGSLYTFGFLDGSGSLVFNGFLLPPGSLESYGFLDAIGSLELSLCRFHPLLTEFPWVIKRCVP